MTTTSYDPAEHYDHVTDAWARLLGDELHYGVFETGDEPLPVATEALTRCMIDAAQLSAGMDVLDVGCGSGAPACRLVSEFGVNVLGITTSRAGVDAAQRRAEAAGLDHARFEVQDGTDNRQPDASFDCAWVLESSHLMRERERLIAECARVLRPGGRLVLCDLIRKREISFDEVRQRRVNFATLRTAFGDAHMESLEYYTETAEQHGLVVDVVEDLTALTLPTFDRWRANAEEYRSEAAAAIGEEGVAAFERSTEILEAFWRDGTFGYGLFAARRP